jgi:hypothetical protein
MNKVDKMPELSKEEQENLAKKELNKREEKR